MNVQLTQRGDGLEFTGTNDAGYEVSVQSASDQDGISPMEMTALSVGGCSSIDVLNILEKQRQPVDGFAVEVDAQRDQENTPAVFTDIHMHYRLDGDVDPDKVRRAIDLSLEKYCSVSHMLRSTASITYSFSINGQEYDAQG